VFELSSQRSSPGVVEEELKDGCGILARVEHVDPEEQREKINK
jgi:hypothetical protein